MESLGMTSLQFRPDKKAITPPEKVRQPIKFGLYCINFDWISTDSVEGLQHTYADMHTSNEILTLNALCIYCVYVHKKCTYTIHRK